jgi:hypothetical protein
MKFCNVVGISESGHEALLGVIKNIWRTSEDASGCEHEGSRDNLSKDV